jgi:membrane-associated protease RseP (regulator of RpoE activity)
MAMTFPEDYRPMRKTALAGSIVLLLLATGLAQAQEAAQVAAASVVATRAGENASLGVEQRLREELRAVMTELIESGAFGDKSPQQIALDVDAPAQRVSNLGLLVDSSGTAHDGLHVLGVTPGGSAEHMGLRAGDVLVALNGAALTDGNVAAVTLRQAVDRLPSGGELAFEVRRENQAHSVSGAVNSVYLPPMRLSIGDGVALAANGASAAAAMPMAAAAATSASTSTGCGRISDFDVAPRQQQLHAAKIISIDGVTPGPTGATAYRVAVGQHVLKVAERIENRYLSFNDRQRNGGSNRDQYKSLTVDVAPDTTTLIAARLNDDKRNEWQGGAYWDPVAWKQTTESCR